MSRSKMLYLAVCLFLGVTSASAQDLWQYIDLNSDAFTKADMTRADVEAAITAAGSAPVDLSGKQLNRLDLSGINLAGANLLAARINGTKLVELGRQHAPPGCPILLYSSRAAAQLHEDARMSGADGFISKSTTGPALVSAVRQWLSEARRPKPAPG